MSSWEEKLEFFSTMDHLLHQLRAVSQKCCDMEKLIEDVKRDSDELMQKLKKDGEKERNMLLSNIDYLQRNLMQHAEKNTQFAKEFAEKNAHIGSLTNSLNRACEKNFRFENELATAKEEKLNLTSEIESLKKKCADAMKRAVDAEESEAVLLGINDDLLQKCRDLEIKQQQHSEMLTLLKDVKPIVFECPNFAVKDFVNLRSTMAQPNHHGFAPIIIISPKISNEKESDPAKVQLTNTEAIVDAYKASASHQPGLDQLQKFHSALRSQAPPMNVDPQCFWKPDIAMNYVLAISQKLIFGQIDGTPPVVTDASATNQPKDERRGANQVMEPQQKAAEPIKDDDSDSCSDESDADVSDVEDPEARNATPFSDSDDYSTSYCDLPVSHQTYDSFEEAAKESDVSFVDDAREEEEIHSADEDQYSESVEESVPADPANEDDVEQSFEDDDEPVCNEKFEHFLGEYRFLQISWTRHPIKHLRNLKLTATPEGVEWSEWDDEHPEQGFTKILVDSEFAANRKIGGNVMLATFKSRDKFETEGASFYKKLEWILTIQKTCENGEIVNYCCIE